jgi:4'-phosphopantetheinyl transferase
VVERSVTRPDALAWQEPPASVSLGDDVHLWRLRLDQPPAAIAALVATLSDDERERADRAATDTARSHFVVARGALRTLLARYLRVDPRAPRFAYADRGKPSLADEALRFNVAHSHGLALIAVSRDRELGVDLERVRALPAADAIAQRFFSPSERGRLASLPAPRRRHAFLSLWTRKEAYLKATGGGLGWGRALADVDVDAGLPGWSILELTPARGFRAALVVAGDGWRLETWRWRPGPPYAIARC